jgi:hypothetical protein
MSETVQDPYESYPIKDDNWFKNNTAHSIARIKKDKGGLFCTVCRHHHCGDIQPVYGNRSLKKSKVIIQHKTKYADKPVIMPDFLSIKNGEILFDDYDF